jgi:hypothetical protein
VSSWQIVLAGAIVVAMIGAHPSFSQSPQDQPTRDEIAEAYRSKSGGGALPVAHLQWERWRIHEVRGWSLHFRRVKESRVVGVLTLQYRALAKKAGACAMYQIIDTVPLGPNSQIRPVLVVESVPTTACPDNSLGRGSSSYCFGIGGCGSITS